MARNVALGTVPSRTGGAAIDGMPHVLYLVRREGMNSVFASQVVMKMKAVAEAGISVEVGVMVPLGHWVRSGIRRRWHELRMSLPQILRGRIVQLPSLPSRFDKPIVDANVFSLWLKRHYGKTLEERPSGLIVQCRNATATRIALWARRGYPGVRVIFDCRGLLGDEFIYKHRTTQHEASESLRRQLERLEGDERIAVAKSDAIFCVSAAMVDYIVTKYGAARERCTIIPCCTDVACFATARKRRREVRERLGLQGRLVVAYCGSLESYQLPHESIRLFRRIKQLEPEAYFLAVTTQPDTMRAAVSDVGLPDDQFTIASVPHEQVPKYLAVADIGLLLREQCALNRVASPVKFAEYLASETPVIISEAVGDYSQLVRGERVGMVLPSEEKGDEINILLKTFLTEYKKAPQEWRERCRRIADDRLDIARYLPTIVARYEKLNAY